MLYCYTDSFVIIFSPSKLFSHRRDKCVSFCANVCILAECLGNTNYTRCVCVCVVYIIQICKWFVCVLGIGELNECLAGQLISRWVLVLRFVYAANGENYSTAPYQVIWSMLNRCWICTHSLTHPNKMTNKIGAHRNTSHKFISTFN